DLLRLREYVDTLLFLRPELVLTGRDLAGGEAMHESVGLRAHEVGDLGLLAEPGKLLRALEPPKSRPAFSGRVPVEGGDEVDEELSHDGVLSTACTDRPPSSRPCASWIVVPSLLTSRASGT